MLAVSLRVISAAAACTAWNVGGSLASSTAAPARARRFTACIVMSATSGVARSKNSRRTAMRGGSRRGRGAPEGGARPVGGGGMVGMGTGEDGEAEGDVLDVSGHEPDVVLGVAERHHAPGADPAERRLEPHQPAVRSRSNVRADRLAAESERNHARGHGG